MTLYACENPCATVSSVLFQSMAWLDFSQIADRLRYVEISAEQIAEALAALLIGGRIETRLTYSCHRIYRIVL